MSKVVGIDLGTTNSLVAYVKDGVPVVIRDRERRRARAVGRLGLGRRHGLRRPRSPAPADDRRAPHGLFREAFHGQGLDDVARRGAAVPVPARRRRRRRRPDRTGRSRVHAARDFGVHSARAEAAGRRAFSPSRARSTPRWTAPSLRCRRISTTRSAPRRATPAASPASTCCASSTSRRPRRSPMGSTSGTRDSSPSTTSAAARSTSRSFASKTASSRCWRPTATRTSAATISTCY